MDPGVTDGIIVGGTYGGTSYAANAQAFAPLEDETINGGAMYPSGKINFTDRVTSIEKLKDGSSNIIFFTHSYSLCGSRNTATVWGYGAGRESTAVSSPRVSAVVAGVLYKPGLQHQSRRCAVSNDATLCEMLACPAGDTTYRRIGGRHGRW